MSTLDRSIDPSAQPDKSGKVREQAIEAGARALWLSKCGRREVAAVVDAVEPIYVAEADRRVDRMILRGDRIYRGMIAQARRDVEAEVRERIAQEIEALGATFEAGQPILIDRNYAARIARKAQK